MDMNPDEIAFFNDYTRELIENDDMHYRMCYFYEVDGIVYIDDNLCTFGRDMEILTHGIN